MKDFKRRIEALEARMISDPLILQFADGSTREIFGPGDFLLDLFCGACKGDPNPVQSAQLGLIGQCVTATEPGGGHMVELLRSLLNSPVDPGGDD
jgi:hypothetical protein